MPAGSDPPGGMRVVSYTAGTPSTGRPAASHSPWPGTDSALVGDRAAGAGSGAAVLLSARRFVPGGTDAVVTVVVLLGSWVRGVARPVDAVVPLQPARRSATTIDAARHGAGVVRRMALMMCMDPG